MSFSSDCSQMIPDYNCADAWMLRPSQPDKSVDVFYVYPTAYFKTPGGPAVCPYTHPAMQIRAREHVRTKGSVFEPYCNYYVPFYPQACVETIVENSAESQQVLTNGPAASVIAAFDTYINHYNHGRPFILAGHSQGSLMLQFLLSIYFKKFPHYLEQMVAAYVIGFSVTRDWLSENPHLQFARGRNDTGVIISYNTEAPGVTGRNITLLKNACCINPINWCCDDTPASSSESLGSQLIIRNSSGVLQEIRQVPHYADAVINPERGVVICSTADTSLFQVIGSEAYFPEGILHTGDYPLYYYDLQQNGKDRIDAFLKKC